MKQAIYENPATPQQPGNDVGGLIGQIENVFFTQQGQADRSVRPASMDPMGDPGAMRGRVRPASEDPYGDPANQGF